MKHRLEPVLLALALAALDPARAGAAEPELDLADTSLEELLAVEVYSASRRSERLVNSTSAVHVITAEDIRRSGMTSVPELLRTVPGMNVAQVAGGAWAISARGGQAQYDRNLLVMIDGRSVYTPIFAGVFWDLEDVPLEDIARIEVVRGPGGALWGANAVNGVINIITRDAAETEGSLVSLRAGNVERPSAVLRHGLRLGENAALRLSGHLRNMNETNGRTGALEGEPLGDGWESNGIWGRLDWDVDSDDRLSFTFNRQHSDRADLFRIYDAAFTDPDGSVVRDHEPAAQGHGGFRWERQLGEGESLALSGFFDFLAHRHPAIDYHQRTADLELQHDLQPGARLGLSWGLGLRNYHTRFRGTPTVNYNVSGSPFDRTTEQQGIYAGFGQATFALVPDVLSLTLGSKLSWNSYTRWEMQPSARLMWSPGSSQHVWAAVSRAVRTPSITDRAVNLVATVLPFVPFANLGAAGLPPTYPCHEFALSPGGTNCPIFLRGSEDFESEVLVAYEAGYRTQPLRDLSLDAALFYFDYENRSAVGVAGVEGGQLVMRIPNGGEAFHYGAEVGTTWQVRPWWQVRAAWWGVQQQVEDEHSPEGDEASTPHHFWLLGNRLDLPWQLELDASVYFQGRREFAANALQGGTQINSHHRVDLRLGWKPRPQLELSLAALDLFDRQDVEFARINSPQDLSQIQRSVYLLVRGSF